MRGNVLEILTGAVVLSIAGLILFYAYVGSKTHDSKGYSLVIKFEKVDGLVEGSDVKMGGIKIGYVDTLFMDADTFEAVARIIIKDTIKLPKDSSAAIVSESLFGGKYLSITPGGDEEILKPGAEIVHAHSSIILESLIGQMVFNNKDAKKEEEVA